MESFGEMLRYYRRQCRDPLRGGLLTQERLGELLGHELGDAGYSGAAVSDWERSKSKINEDDRLVLVCLVTVLHRYGGLKRLDEANQLLTAGNYRSLDEAESARVSPEWGKDKDAAGVVEKSAVITTPQPEPTPLTPERHKQRILLEKVKNFWVKGVLEPSLRETMLIDIAHQRYDEAIDHPWREVVGMDVYDGWAQLVDEKMIDIFRNVDRALLILGGPGSGKTTTLLMLSRDLITLAERDQDQPIPIVLNLVSWAEKQGKLADWVVEELTAKYQIPRRIGRRWLANDELLLLLDGFDEVPAQRRAGCAAAINNFRETHGLTGICICGRLEEYESAGKRLRLGGAILLQPLTQAQVDAYLAAAEARLVELREAVQRDAILQETAQSPLMLTVMQIAYGGADEEQLANLSESDVGTVDGLTARRERLFTTYVARMFQRRFTDPTYAPEQTKQWLAWLARRMSEHNQSAFYIEQIQPSWLPSRKWRWLYLLVSRLITGFVGGIIMWLLLLLLRQIIPEVPTGLSDLIARLLHVIPARIELPLFIVGNLALSLLVGFIHAVQFERYRVREDVSRQDAPQGWWHVGAVGVTVGFLTMLVLVPFGEPLLALSWGIAEAVFYMVISHYVDGRSFRTEVRTVEALGWSWPGAIRGTIIALLLAAAAEAIETRLYGYDGMIRPVLVFGLAGLALGGLQGRRIEVKTRPNQGIRLSLKNAAIAALVSAVPLGLLSSFLLGTTMGMIIMLLMILLVLTLYGGSNVSKHFLVRLLLWHQGYVPWDHTRFLDYACGLVFLRAVGGGFMFIHHMLMEYFAGLDDVQ
jgi:hypothetical protein